MRLRWRVAGSSGVILLLVALNVPWVVDAASPVADRVVQFLSARATSVNLLLLVVAAFVWWMNAIVHWTDRGLRFVNGMRPLARVRLLVTPGAVLLLVADLLRRGLVVDIIPLALFGLAVLPWLTDLVSSARLPGGVEVTFKDLASAEALAGDLSAEEDHGRARILDEWQSTDPALALVALRIEIEKRIRELARRARRPHSGSLHGVIRNLGDEKILSGNLVPGLLELVAAGNAAAHGAEIRADVNEWAYSRGAAVLQRLDADLRRVRKRR